MRGDRPSSGAATRTVLAFTPHARGSTAGVLLRERARYVYPACAGIDLDPTGIWARGIGLPRMRGDRPFVPNGIPAFRLFTPHARGSTRGQHRKGTDFCVYPACAGIDLNPI